MPPRVVAVSSVKNEADIVEAFIRHTLTHCDRMLLIDHGSTDATPDILRSLEAEGLPIVVYEDLDPGSIHAKQMTMLTRRAAGDPDADWVVLLDADEFIVVDGDGSLAEMLQGHREPVLLDWTTYCPDADDDETEPNPVLRITRRREYEPKIWSKIALPRESALRAYIESGNHNAVVDGRARAWPRLTEARLAHFPIRDAAQLVRKVAIGSYRWILAGDNVAYESAYEFLESDPLRFMAEFREIARGFHLPDGAEVGLVPDPLPYAGGPLRYTAPARAGEPWRSLMEFTSNLVQQIARPGQTAGVSAAVEPDAPRSVGVTPGHDGGTGQHKTAPENRDPLLAAALAASRARDWASARERWESYFAVHGDGAPEVAYASSARVYRKVGDFATAGRVVDEGIAEHPSSPTLLIERAEVATAAGLWSDAVHAWDAARVAVGEPFPVAGYAGLARALRELGEADRAGAAVREGLEKYPDDEYLLRVKRRIARAWPWLFDPEFLEPGDMATRE